MRSHGVELRPMDGVGCQERRRGPSTWIVSYSLIAPGHLQRLRVVSWSEIECAWSELNATCWEHIYQRLGGMALGRRDYDGKGCALLVKGAGQGRSSAVAPQFQNCQGFDTAHGKKMRMPLVFRKASLSPLPLSRSLRERSGGS